MTTLLRSAQSLEYVRVPVAVTDDAGALVDPTGDVVSIAFVDSFSKPTDVTTYLTATWETDTSDPSNPVYYARLLVGPGATYEPVAGARVAVWVRVTDNPEQPIILSGDIQFV